MRYSEHFAERIRRAAESPYFKEYVKSRDSILSLIDDAPAHTASEYWSQEVAGFEYLFDASPLIVEKFRHHSYHITGVYEYQYRKHHARKSGPYREKLEALSAIDSKSLFVPESPELGGFGFNIGGKLVNLDTLKFYEFLIGLDRAGFIEPIQRDAHPVVVEIGSGWGGFAYQFKKLFPKCSYVLVDLPESLLFSATYLRALFPNANIFLPHSLEEYANVDFSEYDFVFVPSTAWERLKPQKIDLAMNMVSFQEMTDAQIRSYVSRLADFRCPRIYSLNRDRSPNNEEISGVTALMMERYTTKAVQVLPIPYHVLKAPEPTLFGSLKKFVKKMLGRKSVQSPHEYRHVSGVLT